MWFEETFEKLTGDTTKKFNQCDFALACTVFHQLLIFLMGKKTVVQIGLGSQKTKFQSYRPINDSLPSIFVFGSIIIVKEPLAELKFAIFKNWLDTRPKIETHELRVYPTILGGVSRGFWSPFLDFGARSAIFWHFKMGTFAKSAHFEMPKYGTSSAEI